MSVLTALNERRSQRNFSNEPLPDQLLSNILYAADGINRKGGRRTTATALNWRETDIYVLKANGIWRWVPERNGVLFCSLHDVRDQTYLLQTQLTVPPVELVFVANYARTRNFLSNAVETIAPKIKKTAVDEAEIREARIRACTLDVGIKLQSVYLAAAAMNLACVARTGFRTDKISAALHLKPDEVVIAAQSLGFRLSRSSTISSNRSLCLDEITNEGLLVLNTGRTRHSASRFYLSVLDNVLRRHRRARLHRCGR